MIALAGALHPLGRTAASEEAALALISLQENPFIIESILTLDGGWMAQCPGRSLLPPAAGLIHFRFALGEESEDALRTPMVKLPSALGLAGQAARTADVPRRRYCPIQQRSGY